MGLLAWGTWQPDTSDYESQTQAHNILNVLPRGDGYGPLPSFAEATQGLPDICRGGFYALKSDGSIQVYAGTSVGLYQLNNTNFSWTPVSRVATCTISDASPAVVTVSNSFVAGEPVVFSTTGSLPTGLTAGTVYYAKSPTGSSLNVSATPGGAAINTSSAGSGTQSITSHYSALSSNAQWQFAQTGNLVFATQANEPLQVFDLTSATAFSNSLGSPPQAAYISVVGRFLVLSGLLSQPYRIQWSGLGDFNSSASWTAGTNSSDFQDFPDGGIVRGVGGGEFGTIFQDQAIRRMSYIPGSDIIFQIERVTQDMGLFAPLSIIRAGSTIYFYSNKGFQKIDAGQLPTQIGRERVDRTFLNDLDRTNLQLMIGAADPRTSFVYWAYKSGAGQTGLFDKIIGYDPVLDRFFPLSVSGEYLLGVSQPGITLESLDTISTSIDALTLTLDAYATSVQPQIAAFDASHKLGYFTGPNLEATMESAEQGTDGERLFVNGFRPITDAASFFGSLSARETQQATPSDGTEVAITARTGKVDLRLSTRYARFKGRIPAGTTWTFCAGIEPDTSQDGST